MFRLLIGVVCLLMSVPLSMSAATDDFTVRLLVGPDLTPPSTPILSTVVPVATTQIDLTWLPASDDVYVDGYRVYRDGVFVATTTATQFSDTGLLPATLYTYTVDAFDLSLNYSALSAALATSTLTVYVPPEPPATTSRPTSQATQVRPSTEAVTVVPAERSAAVTFTTTYPTRYIVRFGRTSAYEQGTISGGVYRTEHSTVLHGLEPGTRYYLQIEAVGGRGARAVVVETIFQTKSSVAVSVPPNVSAVEAAVADTDVRLTWQNPPLQSGAVVRVVRSHLFYPVGPQDGVVVYEGVGTAVVDSAALRTRPQQYYSIFVITAAGLSSSGAIATALTDASVPTRPVTPVTPVIPDTATTSVPVTIGGEAINVTLGDRTVPFASWQEVPVATPFAITIPKTALPNDVKAVVVTLTNPTDQRRVAQYLMKLHPNGMYYETEIIAPAEAGEGKVVITVYNFDLAVVRAYEQVVRYTTAGVVRGQMVLTETRTEWWFLVGFVGVVGTFVWSLLRFYFRREDNRHA